MSWWLFEKTSVVLVEESLWHPTLPEEGSSYIGDRPLNSCGFDDAGLLLLPLVGFPCSLLAAQVRLHLYLRKLHEHVH